MAALDDPRCTDADIDEASFDRKHWAWILDAPMRYEARRREQGEAAAVTAAE
ncbi:hypothetical protein ACIG5E_00575 [Kitasatospora sp. NPDC053057]|uniref:hypothetical protein n=1 Tax=Kitasatospora sp. NPDC053057 TaxID=3364062 RepID=UPI0037CAF925